MMNLFAHARVASAWIFMAMSLSAFGGFYDYDPPAGKAEHVREAPSKSELLTDIKEQSMERAIERAQSPGQKELLKERLVQRKKLDRSLDFSTKTVDNVSAK